MSRDLSASGTHAHALASRKEIVAWIQTKYQPSFRGIEELRTGAVFCQILDSVYPDAVALDKVKWDATQEKERLANFQIFQAGLERAQITKCACVPLLALRAPLPSRGVLTCLILPVLVSRQACAGGRSAEGDAPGAPGARAVAESCARPQAHRGRACLLGSRSARADRCQAEACARRWDTQWRGEQQAWARTIDSALQAAHAFAEIAAAWQRGEGGRYLLCRRLFVRHARARFERARGRAAAGGAARASGQGREGACASSCRLRTAFGPGQLPSSFRFSFRCLLWRCRPSGAAQAPPTIAFPPFPTPQQHDFYFGKLRDIEMLCEQVTAEGDSSAVVQRVVELLRLGRDEAKPPSMAVPPLQQGFKPLQQDLNLQHDFSRASEGAESAASGGSVVPTLPLDEMRYHALESARLREKVATARQMIAEEEARRGKHAWLADGSLLLYCTATARDAWEELKEKILACTPLAAAPSPAPSVAPSRPGSSRLRSAVPPTAAASSARSRPRTAQPGSARTSALSSGRAPFTRVSTLGSGRTGVGSSARGPRAPSPVMGSARGRATIPMQ